MTIDDLIQAHAESRRQTVPPLAKTTLAFDQRGYTFLRRFGDNVEDISPRAAEEIKREMFDSGMAVRTLNKSIGCGRATLLWAVKRELIKATPLSFSLNVKRVEERERPRDAFSIEEWRQVRKVADHRKNMLDLYICTGCRRNEIRLLRWDEVHLEDGLFHLAAHRTKSKRSRDCLLGRRMRRMLGSLVHVSEYVFPAANLEKPLGPSNINNYVKELCDHIGRPRTGMTTHSLRYTAMCFLADLKTGARESHLILGHKLKDVLLDVYLVRKNDKMLQETAQALEDYAFTGKVR